MRNGKIARVPHAIRQPLNLRLANGQQGKQLERQHQLMDEVE